MNYIVDLHNPYSPQKRKINDMISVESLNILGADDHHYDCVSLNIKFPNVVLKSHYQVNETLSDEATNIIDNVDNLCNTLLHSDRHSIKATTSVDYLDDDNIKILLSVNIRLRAIRIWECHNFDKLGEGKTMFWFKDNWHDRKYIENYIRNTINNNLNR